MFDWQDSLTHAPIGIRAKPLSGKQAGNYRFRTGDYRLRFYLQGEHVIVDKIGHRSKFYEE